MAESESAACRIREKFENREAIYIEKGALRVRVTNIRPGDGLSVFADIEEIPTKGFEPLRLHYARSMQSKVLLRWTIGGGYLTSFSEHTWEMGYGGWSLFFDPRIIQGVMEMASQWPDGYGFDARAFLAAFTERYRSISRFLTDHDAYEQTTQLFPDEGKVPRQDS